MINKTSSKSAKSQPEGAGDRPNAVTHRPEASPAEAVPNDMFVLTADDARNAPYKVRKDQVLAFDLERNHTSPFKFQFRSPLPQPVRKLLSQTPELKPGEMVLFGAQEDQERYYWTPEMREKAGPNFAIGIRMSSATASSDEIVFHFETLK